MAGRLTAEGERLHVDECWPIHSAPACCVCPHVHLTILDGFADASPTRDGNACRRIVGRGLGAAVDAGLAEGRGACLPRLAVDDGEERPHGRVRVVAALDRGMSTHG